MNAPLQYSYFMCCSSVSAEKVPLTPCGGWQQVRLRLPLQQRWVRRTPEQAAQQRRP